MTLTLYHSGLSTCSQKVRLALAEKGASFHSVELDLISGDQHQPAYRRLNAKSVVPTLVDGDHVITESTVINEYLDDVVDGIPLRPEHAIDRARMRLWTKRLDETIHPQTVIISFSIAFRMNFIGQRQAVGEAFLGRIADPVRRGRMRTIIEQGVNGPEFPGAVAVFNALLVDLDQALQSQDWLVGDRYSLADIAYVPYVTRLAHLGLAGWWRDKPALADWYARVRARPGFATAVDEWLQPPLLAMMAQAGDQAWPVVEEITGRLGQQD
jgi:glutathione S-transferase